MNQLDIYQYLRTHGPKTAKQIATANGITDPNIHHKLNQLQKCRMVERIKWDTPEIVWRAIQ